MLDFSQHTIDVRNRAAALEPAARRLGETALARSTVAIAQKVVSGLTSSTRAGAARETVLDAAALRTDAALLLAVHADMEATYDALLDALLHAEELGLDAEMRWQASTVPGLTWELTDADRAMLHGYPIQGHPAPEMARYMVDSLRYELFGLLSAPFDGSTAAGTITASVGALSMRFGGRTAGAVDEAFYAGVQLGVRTVAEALRRAS